jgi:hypothetical protein
MPKVTYYSVLIGGHAQTEFDDFVERCVDFDGAERDDDVQEVMGIIAAMGEETGAILAEHNYFRNEAIGGSETKAIPGKDDDEYIGNLLRLYCKVICEGIVILYNGGWKTPGISRAQDCKVVGPHFRNANGLSISIDEAIRVFDVGVDERNRKLDFDEGAIFKFKPRG